MGRSITPLYRIEVRTNPTNYGLEFFDWNCKRNGKPTVENLEKWRKEINASFQPGGVNFHTLERTDIVPVINRVQVLFNKGSRVGELVAETNAPMFEVV